VGAVADGQVDGQRVAADDAARRMHDHRVADLGAFREQALEHAQRAVVAEVGARAAGGGLGAVVEVRRACQAIGEWSSGKTRGYLTRAAHGRSPD
jgi:hypothetical protein